MGGRLPPVNHYNLNGGNPLIVNAVHDLNTVDSRNVDVDEIVESGVDPDRNDQTTDSLEQEDDSDSADCIPQSYGHSLQLQGGGVEADHSAPTESEEPPRSPYGVLTAADITPIEAARSRFLQLLLSNFITHHVIPSSESPDSLYNIPNGKEKPKKRKTREVQLEGDPKYVLPLAYVVNLYETLVNEVNARLVTVENVREKNMGVALEAAGGLYRRLIKMYPKSGTQCNFKRREMASAMEARNRFPHLISGDEKRVRFVVVHGLELVEQPNMPYEDAEWFKRLTGRHEAAISERDYKFFAPRHKYRRPPQHSMNHSPVPMQHQIQHQSHAMECHSEHQSQIPAHSQQPLPLTHLQHSPQGSHLTDSLHVQHTSPSQQHVRRGMHPPPLHVGARIMVLPSQPAKYCDECGAPYLRETSKYCSECGTKRVLFTSQLM